MGVIALSNDNTCTIVIVCEQRLLLYYTFNSYRRTVFVEAVDMILSRKIGVALSSGRNAAQLSPRMRRAFA